ncbi:MAG: hypothetical protein JO326_10325, partial [Acetobacteraceae bacterium]|nr:hypothetical protein [Acetobacteraceae bacterium]
DFTVSVDGNPIDGALSVIALHELGQEQTLDIRGNFPGAVHNVAIDFLNPVSGPAPDNGRNLYVDSVSFDGGAVQWGEMTFTGIAPETFTTGLIPQATGSIGSGSDDLRLSVSEDAWEGNALFDVLLDGKVVGGVQTVTALHSLGQDRTLDVFADMLPGTHTLGISFLNDAYDYSPLKDRNLYVDGASLNGRDLANSQLNVFSSNQESFTFTL